MAQEARLKTNTATSKTAPIEKQQVKAFARFIQVSPQKMRLLADMVRNTPVSYALEQLEFSPKKASVPMIKVINSAIANAVHNFSLRKEDLFIKTLTVDGGPVLKRFRPRAQGRAGAIHKRTSHINVVLEERAGGKRTARSIFARIRPTKTTRTQEHKHDHDTEVEEGQTSAPKQQHTQAPKTGEAKKTQKISLKRRLFNRKSGQ
ncbi:MAG TPA: 50S ribosomal protein L22 [Patescibacteria group bacterium]|nr:50S ribosomal protein L22 [Patescibacteria group bacterium]